MSEKQHEQRTIRAYITGFILSLVFTFIPYYLVVNEVMTGTALLLTILGFGVLQMLVQLIFFLHIGRGPNASWNLYFLIGTAVTILVVVGGSIVITQNLHYNMAPADQVKKLVNEEGIYEIDGAKTGACRGQHTNHQVMITTTSITPSQITATQCDTLTFINKADKTRNIVFGEYNQHVSYAGEGVHVVRADKNETITLSETGTFKFHDHLQPEVYGYFTVTQTVQ